MFSRSISNHSNIKQISSLHLILGFPRISPQQMAVQMNARKKLKAVCIFQIDMGSSWVLLKLRMTTKCNYDCNENGLSLNYFSFSLQSLPQDGVEINARPFPVLVIFFVIRIKHHHLSISCILRRMVREEWPEHRLGRSLTAPLTPLRWKHEGNQSPNLTFRAPLWQK